MTNATRVESDEARIRQVIQQWHRATMDGDLDTVLSLMADDAVFLTPGQVPMTKSAFASAFRDATSGVRFESRSEIRELHTSGDIAYCWSHIRIIVTFEGGDQRLRSGDALTVFRKLPTGSWVLSRDANLMLGEPTSGG